MSITLYDLFSFFFFLTCQQFMISICNHCLFRTFSF
nr:MAG TPA: hypothetical protein [Caudoviricetes sp.]